MNINAAIKYFGSKKSLADAIGVSKQAVTEWGERIPVGRQFQIEVLTGGKLKAAQPTQDRAA